MNRMLVVVFNEASQAFEGRDALKNLDRDDSLALHAYAIITRKADGSIVNEEDHHAGLSLPPGTSLRRLIDHFGKTTEVAISTAADYLAPGTKQDEARVVADFANEVSQHLTPGKFALVAEIDEEWTPWINLRMEELGGVVYRCPLSDVKQVAESADISAMKAELAQMKAELPGQGQATKPSCSKRSINLIPRFSNTCRRQRNGVKLPRLRQRLRQKPVSLRRRRHGPRQVEYPGLETMKAPGQHKCAYSECECVVGVTERRGVDVRVKPRRVADKRSNQESLVRECIQ